MGLGVAKVEIRLAVSRSWVCILRRLCPSISIECAWQASISERGNLFTISEIDLLWGELRCMKILFFNIGGNKWLVVDGDNETAVSCGILRVVDVPDLDGCYGLD
jgi:hypothetical protein